MVNTFVKMKQFSIQIKLGFILFFTITTVMAAFSVYHYFKTESDMNKELNILSDFFAKNLSASLEMSLWEVDHAAVEKIINSAMLEKQIFAILIKNGKNILYGKRRDSKWNIINTSESIVGDYYLKNGNISKNNLITNLTII